MVDALKEHRRHQASERLAAGPEWRDQGLIFCISRGTPLDPAGVRKVFHRALRQVGLPDMRPHDLRHTAATLLLRQGVHPKLVQEMLGHSSITLTLGTYSHVLASMHGQAADEMDAMFYKPDRSTQPKRAEEG